MLRYHWFKNTAAAIVLSAYLVSCQARPNKPIAQQPATNPEQNSESKISYGDLVIKEESDYIMIPVILSDAGNQNKGGLLSSRSYSENRGGFNNIIFYQKKDGQSHLLLNQKVFIASFDLLEKKAPGKPVTRFWLYKIVKTDTNGDQELNFDDANAAYLSDLSGKNLQQITPDNTQFLSWVVVQSVSGVFFKIVKDSDNDQKFTERDETTFIKVNLDQPGIGTEIISDKIKQELKSIQQK
jgi:hypothetical protein